MDTPASISCIVPAYNSAAYLRQALDSIFGQTLAPREVIVVDDGSTDNTRALVETYAHPVAYLQQPNLGPAAARNRGIKAAGGAYLAFIDADDIWHRDKLALQMARLEARPELGYCLTYKRQFWEPCLRDEERRLRAQDHPITHDGPGFVMQTMLARRACFDRVGLLDESLRIGEDTDWLLRAEDLGVIREILTEVLVFRRMHTNNLSYRIHSREGIEDRMQIALRSLDRKRTGAGKRSPER